MYMKTNGRKVELLAPAGSFQGFIGALNGGADAVYLAGERFGARAYADNFTREEIEEAILLGKIFGVKIYLTVNTLLKNKEMNELYDYIKPLYEMGLTGVIIQDFGVFEYLKRHFPGLELHASTQMSVTSLEGAKYLEEAGAKRVVLARELTLKEVKEITAAGIETECFIHGSMCYCYSGQCLFSSLIGGRSGNRGRCAQPCRLPYQTNGKDGYCLSLKDMCTLEHIPDLIDAGITSFKIEGRMKNPAYAAWVTGIYRKYMDMYLNHPDKEYKVDRRDLEKLKNLYIRSELQDGYYYKYRGKDMITLDNPAYSKTDEAFVTQITEEMILSKPKKSITLIADFSVGKPCECSVLLETEDKTYEVFATGEVVQEAIKAPLSKDAIKDRLCKTGDYPFFIENIQVNVEGNIFMPVKAINELRRNVLDKLIACIKNELKRDRVALDKETNTNYNVKDNQQIKSHMIKTSQYISFVETKEQLQAVLQAEYINRVVLPLHWLETEDVISLQKACKEACKSVYFALPAICRNGSWKQIDDCINKSILHSFGEGVYVNQIDSMAHIAKHYSSMQCLGDLHMYGTNREASDYLAQNLQGFTVSVELNKDELKHMNLLSGEMILYGRTPLMHTANCIFLTTGKCHKNHKEAVSKLKDKTKAEFPYRGHCEESICYNTVYNSVPTSLHKHKTIIDSFMCQGYQLRFTTENFQETKTVLDLYQKYAKNEVITEVPFAYTNGHFLRGIQ